MFSKILKFELLIAIAVFLIVLVMNSYVLLSESDKNGVFSVLAVCWSLLPAFLFIFFKNKCAYWPLRISLGVTAWSVLIGMLLFSVFILMASIQSDGLREAGMIYIVPLIYPILFVPKIFITVFIVAFIYKKIKGF